MSHWLMKSEPDVFSIHDLAARPGKREPWNGVRNYQARNFMRDDMKKGDRVLFYHSNCKEPGVAGLAEIVSDRAYPDDTQFDTESPYFDPKATADNPRWMLVDVGFVAVFSRVVTLRDMRQEPKLADMLVLRRGMRLSIQPVEEKHFRKVCAMGGIKV